MTRTHATIAAVLALTAALLAGVARAERPVTTELSQAVYVQGGSLVLTQALATAKLQPSATGYPSTSYFFQVTPVNATTLEVPIFDAATGVELAAGKYKEGAALTAGATYEWSQGADAAFKYDLRPGSTGTLVILIQQKEGAGR